MNQYWSYTDEQIDTIIHFGDMVIKERVMNVGYLHVEIFSRDHNPPHFHVFSKDKKVNVKFTIENCELISGEIDAKSLKKIRTAYRSEKGKILMEKMWNKRNQ